MTITAIRSTLNRFDRGDITRRQLEMLLSDDHDPAWGATSTDEVDGPVDWGIARNWLSQPDAASPGWENGGLLLADLVGLDA